MDNGTLDALLSEGRERGYWIKPVGLPSQPLEQQPEIWTDNVVETHFAICPARVATGDILIAFRTGVSKIIYVAECLEQARKYTEAEQRLYAWRGRWPWFFRTRNLTPEYGRVWNQFRLKPFLIARAFNAHCTGAPARLGTLQFGSTVAEVPREFAEQVIRQIRALS